MKCGQTVDDLISAIYPDLHLVDPLQDNATWFSEHSILPSLNSAVDYLNEMLVQAIGPWLYNSSAKSNQLQYNMSLHQLSD